MSDFWGSQNNSLTNAVPRVEIRPLMRLVYMWMGIGLLVTALIATMVAGDAAIHRALIRNPSLLFGALIGELVLVVALTAGIRRMSANLAGILFFVYSALNGVTLSLIFWVYTDSSITAAFVTTAALFGVMTVVGFTTTIDLTRYRTYFLMGLIGLLVAMIVNLFIQSGPFDLLISLAGVVLFTALTAYDTQKIKIMAADPTINADGNLAMKLSIIGALSLYLDFINLFLFLLRLFGRRR